jgi:hypothetical protein
MIRNLGIAKIPLKLKSVDPGVSMPAPNAFSMDSGKLSPPVMFSLGLLILPERRMFPRQLQ